MLVNLFHDVPIYIVVYFDNFIDVNAINTRNSRSREIMNYANVAMNSRETLQVYANKPLRNAGEKNNFSLRFQSQVAGKRVINKDVDCEIVRGKKRRALYRSPGRLTSPTSFQLSP